MTYLPSNYAETIVNSSYSIKQLVAKSCTLFTGLVSYDIILQNQTVRLKSDNYSQDTFLEAV
jgi:hypothetical protein